MFKISQILIMIQVISKSILREKKLIPNLQVTNPFTKIRIKKNYDRSGESTFLSRLETISVKNIFLVCVYLYSQLYAYQK